MRKGGSRVLIGKSTKSTKEKWTEEEGRRMLRKNKKRKKEVKVYGNKENKILWYV